jgi:2-polyprenyl-3-methyl-5-hydroxy-6-metoxy-1,4-benzoquinol methylase
LDTRKEINPALEPATKVLAELPGLPNLSCGWILRTYQVADRELKVMVPYRPDALLDDPAVRAANAEDDYMPYWAYLWPAALIMAKAVLQSGWPAGTRVLELGCGVGLVGLSALAAGCRVSLTDYDVMAVEIARHNADLNGFSDFLAFPLDWRSPPPERYSVVMGCDVTYEQRNHSPILDLLEKVLEPDGVCWLADGGRAVSTGFWTLCNDRGFDVITRNAMGEEIERPGIHYQLFELRKKRSEKEDRGAVQQQL